MLAANVDHNQARIVSTLRAVGASVQTLHTIGRGCPDLLVGYRGVTYLVEIKSEKGMVLDSQEAWMKRWKGGIVHVVRAPNEALRVIGMELL